MSQHTLFHKFSGFCPVTLSCCSFSPQDFICAYNLVYSNLSQPAQEVLNATDNINAIMTQDHNSKVAKTTEQCWSGTLSADTLFGVELGKAL